MVKGMKSAWWFQFSTQGKTIFQQMLIPLQCFSPHVIFMQNFVTLNILEYNSYATKQLCLSCCCMVFHHKDVRLDLTFVKTMPFFFWQNSWLHESTICTVDRIYHLRREMQIFIHWRNGAVRFDFRKSME